MKKFKHLPWDSDFFGFDIGVFNDIDDNISSEELIEISDEAGKSNIKCLYLQLPFDTSRRLNLPANFKVYDIKTTLDLSLAAEFTTANIFHSRPEQRDLKDLMLIAEILAAKSRYSKDPGFGMEKAEKLYKEWVSKSFLGDFAEGSWYTTDNTGVTGLITVRNKNDVPYIDLIGVAPNSRGSGLSAALLNKAAAVSKENGFSHLRVITQGDNIEALRFYEKNSFRIREIGMFYHVWSTKE